MPTLEELPIGVLHPLTYFRDHVSFEEGRSTATTWAGRRREAQIAAVTAAVTRSSWLWRIRHANLAQCHTGPGIPADTFYVIGDSIPDDVEYLADVRGNLWVRWAPGARRWWRPARDSYGMDAHPFVPPVRATWRVLRYFAPVVPIPAALIPEREREMLDALKPASGQDSAPTDDERDT